VKGQVGYGIDVFQSVLQPQLVLCELADESPQTTHFIERVAKFKVEFSFIHGSAPF